MQLRGGEIPRRTGRDTGVVQQRDRLTAVVRADVERLLPGRVHHFTAGLHNLELSRSGGEELAQATGLGRFIFQSAGFKLVLSLAENHRRAGGAVVEPHQSRGQRVIHAGGFRIELRLRSIDDGGRADGNDPLDGIGKLGVSPLGGTPTALRGRGFAIG